MKLSNTDKLIIISIIGISISGAGLYLEYKRINQNG